MISVIVPVYNVELYLEACIQSILNQTYYDLEIILVDDGSTDNSGEICDTYQKKDNRICVIHKQNGGLSDARNAGLGVAKGEYIAFVDADDIIHPQTYECLERMIREYRADISSCGITRDVDDMQKTINYKTDLIHEYTVDEAFKDIRYILISVCNKLYRKYIWEKLRFPVGKFHEDEFVFHYTIGQAQKIVSIEYRLYCYVQRQGSITYQLSKERIKDAMEALEDRIIYMQQYHDITLRETASHNFLQYLIMIYSEIGKYQKHSRRIDISTEGVRARAKEISKKYAVENLSREEKLFINHKYLYGLYHNFMMQKKVLYELARRCKRRMMTLIAYRKKV